MRAALSRPALGVKGLFRAERHGLRRKTLSHCALAISLDSAEDVLLRNPFAGFVHDARFEHRRRARPMQFHPARYLGLTHAVAPADAFGHLSRQRFDVGTHDIGTQYLSPWPMI